MPAGEVVLIFTFSALNGITEDHRRLLRQFFEKLRLG